ncbi:MAG: pyridoxamine 5'-phosphate oxidase family protein [Deferrisomatales bacterium]|nr:pyridoxamine 5'-phosphate oxidase family protein [Deferrisomatales bacterium]
MDWKEYFEGRRGTGFMATANKDGEVNIAVYSRPRVTEDGTLAFGMTDRLTHKNLRDNPKAAYAFQEPGFQGVRLYLEKVREETSGPVLEEVRRRADQIVGSGAGEQVEFLVCFRVIRHLNLVGPGTPT